MAGRLPVISDSRPSPTLSGGPKAAFAGNVALVTLGCAKNQVDSEVMLGSLVSRGYSAVQDPSEADLIIVNTCAFLQSAVEEGVDRILELIKFRKEGRCRRLVVAGCMVERYREQLLKELPEVDRFISTDELLLAGDETPTSAECLDSARRPYFLYDGTIPRVVTSNPGSAFVKIAEGCDRPCSFCIIPKLRGPFRSRALDSIVEEVRALQDQGVKEFNLIGQDLTAYGSDRSPDRKGYLPELLRKLALSSPNDAWFRLLYAYPIGVTDELIDLIRDCPSICSYLDLPLQHISANVLKRMRRPLGERGTRALIEKIKLRAPQIALRTTFIVGFPGETEQDIEALNAFVKEGHFTHVGVFTYSQEEEAPSFTYPNQLDETEKEARRRLIMESQQELVLTRLNALVGRRETVLVEGPHPETDMLLSARAEWQAPETDGCVIINDASEEAVESGALFGSFAEAEISDVVGYDLVARLVES